MPFGLLWVGLAALLLQFYTRSVQPVNGLVASYQQTPFRLDSYWAWEWKVNYAPGFIRRGLLGNLFNLIHTNAERQVIAVLGLIICLGLCAIFYQSLHKLIGRSASLFSGLLVFAILLSPSSFGLLFECLGDPLQLVILIFLAILGIAHKNKKLGTSLGFGVAVCLLGALGSLVHEAQIFFTVMPMIACYWLKRPMTPAISQTAKFWIFGSLVAFAGVILFGQATTHWKHIAESTIKMTTTAEPLKFPVYVVDSYGDLAQNELITVIKEILHGAPAGVQLSLLFARLSIVLATPTGLLLLLAIPGGEPKKINPSLGKLFFLSLLCTTPLFLIAHDWGRFVGYLLVVTLTLYVLTPMESETSTREPQSVDPLFVTGIVFLALGGIASLSPTSDEFRVTGRASWNGNGLLFIAFEVIGIALVCLAIRNAFTPTNGKAQSP